MSRHTYTMDLRVHDKGALYEAARRHAVEVDGLSEEEAQEQLKDDDEINVHACLITLLDPGLMAGCEIDNSSCEEF